MRIAIIGRSEILYDTAQLIHQAGHCITCFVTSKAAPEYTRTAADFERLAGRLAAAFVSTVKIDSQIPMLRSSDSEIGVSINYTGVVPQSVIDLFPLGILNAHGGDLPRFRGNACQAWAILNGEPRVGLCIHKMVGGELDSGDIIAREHLTIDESTKVTDIWSWMHKRIPELMLQAVNKLSQDPEFFLEKQSKDWHDALRCYPRRPEDGRIKWQESALQILRLINASNKPYAGAFCYFNGQKMIVWDADLVLEPENFCALPGQVTQISNGFVEVACAQGKLRILTIAIDGKVSTPDVWIKSIRERLR